MITKCKRGIPTLTEMLADIGIPVLTEIFLESESKFPEFEPLFLHTKCLLRRNALSQTRLKVANYKVQNLEIVKKLGLNSKSKLTFCNRSCYKFVDISQARQQCFTNKNGCVCEVLHLCQRICSNKNCKT